MGMNVSNLKKISFKSSSITSIIQIEKINRAASVAM
jgi:hypothetical protein